MPLTDVAIRNAKPRDKPYKVGDTLGLFLLVQPSGGKLWRVKYRIDGKEKKLAIGIYPQVGLAEARRSKSMGCQHSHTQRIPAVAAQGINRQAPHHGY
jgi:hypothetical protein